LFDRVRHESELRDKLEQSFGHLLGGYAMSTDKGNMAQASLPEPTPITAVRG
jgi:hypothetical protein